MGDSSGDSILLPFSGSIAFSVALKSDGFVRIRDLDIMLVEGDLRTVWTH